MTGPNNYDHLERATSWVIATFRGNNDCSDDKSIHMALSSLELHYGWERSLGSCRKRLDSLTARADEMGKIGRALIWACWAIRIDQDPEEYERGNDYEGIAWNVIHQAEDAVRAEQEKEKAA